MSANEKTIAILGGGAAGLCAAIAAAEQVRAGAGCAGVCAGAGVSANVGGAGGGGGAGAGSAARGVRVVIYEKDDRVGRSILATGNGRCNFSNASLYKGEDVDIFIDEFHNADFVAQVLRALPQVSAAPAALPQAPEGLDAVHEMFRRLGLVWREEADGREYPLANKASVVLDVLRARLDALGVEVATECEVAAVEPPRADFPRYTLRMKSGVIKRADAVVVAVGGRTVSALQVGEIKRSVPRPLLGPLSVADKDKLLTRELDNIRVRCAVSLCREPGKPGAAGAWAASAGAHARADTPGLLGAHVRANTLNAQGEVVLATERGELLFRKYGVSGICVFNLSRAAQEGDTLRINFLEALGENAAGYLARRRDVLAAEYGERLTYMDLLRGLLLPRVAEGVLKASFINPYNRAAPEDIGALAALLTGCPLRVEGIADPTLCQVRRGGFKVEGFSAHTLEARSMRGLYAAGEALDVDGPCGGYNLHWAWASGMVAGAAAGQFLVEPQLQR